MRNNTSIKQCTQRHHCNSQDNAKTSHRTTFPIKPNELNSGAKTALGARQLAIWRAKTGLGARQNWTWRAPTEHLARQPVTWHAPRWKLARANCEVGAPICYFARAKFVSRVTTSHACKAPRGHTFSLQEQKVRRALSTRTRSNISAS